MEKIKYYLAYDAETRKVISVSVEQPAENYIFLELNETEFINVLENLDFSFVDEDEKLFVDNAYKERYFAKINSRDRIQELKKFLSDSDWKVIVNSELVQAGLTPKYPNLHAERQAWRDEINQLEELSESSEQ